MQQPVLVLPDTDVTRPDMNPSIRESSRVSTGKALKHLSGGITGWQGTLLEQVCIGEELPLSGGGGMCTGVDCPVSQDRKSAGDIQRLHGVVVGAVCSYLRGQVGGNEGTGVVVFGPVMQAGRD